MALTVKWKAPVVITSLGVREDVNAAAHAYGGVTLHDIINNRFALKAIENGADGLIAVAAGAGGHAGSVSPFALRQDIRAWFDGPLLLSGAILGADHQRPAPRRGAASQPVGPNAQEAKATAPLLIALLDPRVDRLGEDRKPAADERGGEARRDEDGDHLRYEGQRHLLHLGQGLQERDDHADRHRRGHARSGADHDHPDRRLHQIDRVAFVHWTVAPLASETVEPLVRVATAPVLVTLTEATWPDVEPSEEVMVWPTSCSA